MREILFRGKSSVLDDWIYGYLVVTKVGNNDLYTIIPADDLPKILTEKRWFQVDPDTVGQFTGLTDKNGRKVFEGDILKEEDIVVGGGIQIQGDVWSVGMRKGCWVVESAVEWDFLSTNAGKCAVIGNVHDNPGLLDQ
mgnify:CR=1 FL=1